MTRLSEASAELKASIRKDYLDGVSVPSLMVKYGFSNVRNVYYHLKPLTMKDKIKHFKNSNLEG